MSRKTGEKIGSALCLAALITCLIWVDARVRERFWALLAGASSDGISPWSERIGVVSDAIARTAHDHSISNAPLLIFSMVAVVLVLFMMRT